MFLKIFLENTGMALDIVQQSNFHGGTSTDGNSGRCFFLVKNVLLLLNYAYTLYKKYQKPVLHLHLLVSTIFRAISVKGTRGC